MFYLLNMIGGLVGGLLSLGLYLLSSYAVYKVAKIRFIPNAWLAFIPIFSLYMVGLIIDSLKYNHYKINQYISDIPMAYALPIASLAASSLLPMIPILGAPAAALIEVALWVAQVLMYYFLFSLYSEPKHTLPFTVISALIPLAGPVLILYTLKDRRY